MVHTSSALSRDAKMIPTSEYEEENACIVLILLLNEISLFLTISELYLLWKR